MLLNEDEMTRLWLLRKGYEPLRSDCRIERSDGATCSRPPASNAVCGWRGCLPRGIRP